MGWVVRSEQQAAERLEVMGFSGRKPHGLSIYQQSVALKPTFPAENARLKCGRLLWQGYLQPSPISERYLVRLSYAPPYAPVVHVVSPKLVRDENGDLPHVYPGDRLCLHYPEEWSAEMCIAETVLPWTSEWLLHYEIWRITGKWHGGGHEPKTEAA